jgi:isoleucyl-tRNA synthetase
LTRLIAPILVYTADEIWEVMPKRASDDPTNIVFNPMPAVKAADAQQDSQINARWERIRSIRGEVLAVLEAKRAEKVIGKSLEAKVTLRTGQDLSDISGELATAFIVSQVEVVRGDSEQLEITVEKADGEKCERCWVYSTSMAGDLCERCARVVADLE